MLYDICLFSGCYEYKNFDKILLIASISVNKLLEKQPGLLQLDLSVEDAFALLQELRVCGARGWVVPSMYRNPKIAVEEARRIAEPYIKHEQLENSEESWEPMRYYGDDPMKFYFVTDSPSLQEKGWIPGIFTVYVDKIDGHVWSSEELSKYGEYLENKQAKMLDEFFTKMHS